MKTFELNGQTFAFDSKGKLKMKDHAVKTVKPHWGIETWTTVDIDSLKNEELPEDDSIKFGKDFPKIPFDVILKARGFFREVYKVHKSEAFAFFHYCEEEGYELIIPVSQDVSSGHVSFDCRVKFFCSECKVGASEESDTCPVCGTKNSFKPAIIVGSTHSHGSMSAFHSGTDDDNELTETGAHITLGHLHQDKFFEIAPSYVDAGPNSTDKDGKGFRYHKSGIDLFDLVDVPFHNEGQSFRHWMPLITSTVALRRLPAEHQVLAKGTSLVNISGDTDLYTRLQAIMEGGSEMKVLTRSTYDTILKAAEEAAKKAKSASIRHGSQQSKNGTASGAAGAQKGNQQQGSGHTTQKGTTNTGTNTTSTSKTNLTKNGGSPKAKSKYQTLETEKSIEKFPVGTTLRISIDVKGALKLETNGGVERTLTSSAIIGYSDRAKAVTLDIYQGVINHLMGYMDSNIACIKEIEQSGLEIRSTLEARLISVLGMAGEITDDIFYSEITGSNKTAYVRFEDMVKEYPWKAGIQSEHLESVVSNFLCLWIMQSMTRYLAKQSILPIESSDSIMSALFDASLSTQIELTDFKSNASNTAIVAKN